MPGHYIEIKRQRKTALNRTAFFLCLFLAFHHKLWTNYIDSSTFSSLILCIHYITYPIDFQITCRNENIASFCHHLHFFLNTRLPILLIELFKKGERDFEKEEVTCQSHSIDPSSNFNGPVVHWNDRACIPG